MLNNNMVIKTNVYYQRIFYNRLNSFIDNIRNASDNNIISLTEPKKVYINLRNGLNDLFLAIYDDNNKNYLEKHNPYLEAIYELLIYDCIDKFEYCHKKIIDHVKETDIEMYYKSQESSLTATLLEGMSINDFCKNNKLTFKGFAYSAAVTIFENKKQEKNINEIFEMKKKMGDNISELIEYYILDQIDAVFQRTLINIPIFVQSIYEDNFFTFFANIDIIGEDDSIRELKYKVFNNPNDLESKYQLACYYFAIEKYYLSLALINEAIEIDFNNLDYLELSALNQLILGLYPETSETIDKALSIDKDNKNILSILCRLKLYTDEYDEALKISDRLLQYDPENEDYLLLNADCLLSLDKLKDSHKIYQKLFKNSSFDKEIIKAKIDFIKEKRNLSNKNYKFTLFLSIVFPSFQRFYTGRVKLGFLYIIILIASFVMNKIYIFGIFYLLDICLLLLGKFKDKNGKYVSQY